MNTTPTGRVVRPYNPPVHRLPSQDYNMQTQVVTGVGIDYMRFASLKGQLKLEQLGMKSSGGPLRPRLAKEFNLGKRVAHAEYIAYCEAQMQSILKARENA